MPQFNLDQFVKAQAPVYDQVVRELRAGRKQTHWMWFIFPQLVGLGSSLMSKQFGIPGLNEARDYLSHPILGRRLLECTRIVNRLGERSPLSIFGNPDDMKFHSSMTLFDRAHPSTSFREALDTFFHGRGDPRTLELLQRARVIRPGGG
ncbi:DUF1810 domain-containing protein [Acidisoma sp. 7E03]